MKARIVLFGITCMFGLVVGCSESAPPAAPASTQAVAPAPSAKTPAKKGVNHLGSTDVQKF